MAQGEAGPLGGAKCAAYGAFSPAWPAGQAQRVASWSGIAKCFAFEGVSRSGPSRWGRWGGWYSLTCPISTGVASRIVWYVTEMVASFVTGTVVYVASCSAFVIGLMVPRCGNYIRLVSSLV